MEEIGIEVIKKCQNGSAEAFAAVVDMYEKRIFSYVYKFNFKSTLREEIEDLVQEVFLKAYCNIHAFDPGRGAKFSTWLYTIARNHCLSFLQKKTINTKLADTDISDMKPLPDHKSRTARDEVLEKELSGKVADAITLLPEEQKSALLLQYYEGLSYEEIADVMRCSIGTVKSRLARARDKLYQHLKEYL